MAYSSTTLPGRLCVAGDTAMVRKTALSKRKASGCPCCAPGKAGPFSLGRAIGTAHSEADLYEELDDDEPVAVSGAVEAEPPRSETVHQPQGEAPVEPKRDAAWSFTTASLTQSLALVLALVAATTLVAVTAHYRRR